MTKEELKSEAEQYSYGVPIYQIEQQLEKIQKAYLAGAEPREKRIAELEDKLANADYQLEGRDNEIKELKAQIGKMKSCRICVSYDDLAISDWSPCKTCKNKSNWELSD